MRATSITGVALAIFALSACGRSGSDVERTSGRQVLSAPASDTSSLPRKSPGQARLSALKTRSTPAPSRTKERAPLATYSQYDGRGPGAASVPGDVAEAGPKLAALLPRTDQSGKDRLDASTSERDIVDLGLNSSPPNGSAKPKRNANGNAQVALARAPAPVPRPVTQTPNPMTRPTVAGGLSSVPQQSTVPSKTLPAAPLPAEPSIAALKAPSLSAPSGMRDLTPTGLPRFGQAPTPGTGIPLGKVPASLGVMNIRSAEAAQPAADELERSTADESGAIGWDEASALIRAGEVETFVDIGEFEVLLTLCSGRGVISIQPTPGAISDVKPPKVICGK